MPPVPDIDELSPAVLAQHYDQGSIRRGTGYAAAGHARLIDHTDGELRGIVRGSSRSPYMVEIEWWRDHRGVSIHDLCSCPLGGSCKHAVALILTARRTAPAPPPDWRRALSEILQGSPANAAGEGGAAPLAIEFSVTVPKPTTYAPEPSPQVAIRPMRMGRQGKWIKTGASWRDVSSPYGYELRDCSQVQRALIAAMLSGARDGGYYPPSGSIPLTSFGPEVWAQLRHAMNAGVELIRDRVRFGVTVSDTTAQVVIDMTTTAADDIAVTFGFLHDGASVELQPGSSGTLGDPLHGLFVLHDELLELIPLDRTMPRSFTRALRSPPISVPGAEIDELFDQYQPLLSAMGQVGSSDGSVSITTPVFDSLVALVDHRRVDSATLQWAARYRRGERVTDHALSRPTAAGRDRTAERAAIEELELPTHLLGALVDDRGYPTDVGLDGRDAIVLLTSVIPWLTDRGQVAVEVSGDAPTLREASTDPLIELSVTPSGNDTGRNDWFDLDVRVSVDDQTIEFSELFAALTRNAEVLVLDSGTWLRLDRPEFDTLRELIAEARGLADHDVAATSATVRINRFQSSWWDELAALGVVARQSEQWERSISSLREIESPSVVPPPDGLEASLRSYQQEGFDWLVFLHRHRLGGILADDMGLGKTVQTLALMLHVAESKPDARFLVVAPTSVVENWRREAHKFAPDLSVCTISGTAARRGAELADTIGDAQVVVTSYALFRIEVEQYQSIDWEILVLDEAQFVKNHRGKTYQCVRRLDAATKLAVTGTPLENSLMDLWSLLSITAPGLYPDPSRFSEVYRRPIESGRAPELLSTLRRRIAPLMRRRTKDEVLTDLPPKTELTVEVEMGARHARIYQTQLQRQRQRVLGLVGDVDKHRFEILKSLTMLRQLSLDPGLVDPKHDGVGSAKLDRLIEDLEQVVAEGHRALVFSQFTRYLARVRTRLDAAGIDHSYLDGRTRKRDAAIDSFKNGTNPVFVISLKAGGFGLNLTEADYCFVLDPWWNPAVETQAVDRTHRIGQRNAVMVYRYVSSGTIEEKVMELKQRKAALFSSVLDADGALSGALDSDDIRALFEL